jgi:hypothetical protein
MQLSNRALFITIITKGVFTMSLIEGSGIIPDGAPEGVKRELSRRYLSQFFNRRKEELSLMTLFLASSMYSSGASFYLENNYG